QARRLSATSQNPSREAPRRSPRPVRRLWRATRHAPITMAANKTRLIAWPIFCFALGLNTSTLSGVDQGPIIRKETGLPRQDAASTRNASGGQPGNEQV